MAKITTIEEYWEAWEKEDRGEGRVSYLPDKCYGSFSTTKESEQVVARFNKMESMREKIPPWLEEIMRELEPQLKKAVWKEMKKSAPNMYGLVIISVSGHRNLKELVEDIEDRLHKRSLSWISLEALKHIDTDLIASANYIESEAKAMEKILRRAQQKHEECGKFIISRECLFSESLKRQMHRELADFPRWLKEYEKRNSAAEKRIAEATFEKLARKQKELLKQGVTSRIRSSAVFNALIFPLVGELLSAGFSKKGSCEITDRILKVLYPFYWPDVDEFSFKRVRQRYEYWLKKKKG